MFMKPNTENSLCFAYILGTTVTCAFVNHVGFLTFLSYEDLISLSRNYFEDTIVSSKIVRFVNKCETFSFLTYPDCVWYTYTYGKCAI